jgi:flagellar biosynthetic protein FliR/FlhB
MLVPMINQGNAANIDSNFMIILCCCSEVATGLILGYVTNLCFQFASMAGQFMDVHVGFAMNRMFDPLAEESVTTLGRVMYWFAVMLFLIVDGHHVLIRGLAYSFQTINIGEFILSHKSFLIILKAFIEFFVIGVKISIPITLIILITNLVLGLIARSVPQLNVMILGLPIKILIGVVSFTIALPLFAKILMGAFDKIPYIIESLFKAAPIMLIFADSGGEKTEEATPKKKADAKKKGQIAKSKELSLAFSLITVTILLLSVGNKFFIKFQDIILLFFNNYLEANLNYNTLNEMLVISIVNILKIFLTVAVPMMVIGVAVNYMQSGFIFTTETLKPDLKKLNPISGFKKLFSIRSLVTLVKDIIIVSIVGIIGYKFIRNNYGNIMSMGSLRLSAIPYYLNKLMVEIFFKISIIMLIIAIADYIFQLRQHKKDLRMSKQEIKEEFKQSEGDPQVKSKIKEKQRQMSMARMMQSVPDATVVVTNPTHIAVAIRYKDGVDQAPIVTAKGADFVAIKIKEIAKDNEVPIIENKILARLMYSQIEIDEQIPAEMYQAVAEILALVYKLKK